MLAHDDEQLRLAEASRDRIETVLRRPVLTRIERLDRFYLAEDYHQKYRLRNAPIAMRDFRAAYASDAALVDSTVAARLNGYLDGGGSCAQFDREVDGYGVSPSTAAYLRRYCR